MPEPKPSVDMYPSADELLHACRDILFPESLVIEVRKRYDEHGMEYATELRHTDGRIVNGCMEIDSYESAREEIVDAFFNLLVANFKQGGGVSAKTFGALLCVRRAWEILIP